MLNIAEPLLIAVAFLIAWDYCQPWPLLWPGPDMAPVTLEDQRAAEWLATIRPPVLAPHTGTRVKSAYSGRRRASSEYPAGNYSRGKR